MEPFNPNSRSGKDLIGQVFRSQFIHSKSREVQELLRRGGATVEEIASQSLSPSRAAEVFKQYVGTEGYGVFRGPEEITAHFLSKAKNLSEHSALGSAASEFLRGVEKRKMAGVTRLTSAAGKFIYIRKNEELTRWFKNPEIMSTIILGHEAAEAYLSKTKTPWMRNFFDRAGEAAKKINVGHTTPEIYNMETELASMLGKESSLQLIKHRVEEISNIGSFLKKQKPDFFLTSEGSALGSTLYNLPRKYRETLAAAGVSYPEIERIIKPIEEATNIEPIIQSGINKFYSRGWTEENYNAFVLNLDRQRKQTRELLSRESWKESVIGQFGESKFFSGRHGKSAWARWQQQGLLPKGSITWASSNKKLTSFRLSTEEGEKILDLSNPGGRKALRDLRAEYSSKFGETVRPSAPVPEDRVPLSIGAKSQGRSPARRVVEGVVNKRTLGASELTKPGGLADQTSGITKALRLEERSMILARTTPYAVGVAIGADVLASRDKTGPFWGALGAGLSVYLTKGMKTLPRIASIGGAYLGLRALAGTLHKVHQGSLPGLDEQGEGSIIRKQYTDFGSGFKGVGRLAAKALDRAAGFIDRVISRGQKIERSLPEIAGRGGVPKTFSQSSGLSKTFRQSEVSGIPLTFRQQEVSGIPKTFRQQEVGAWQVQIRKAEAPQPLVSEAKKAGPRVGTGAGKRNVRQNVSPDGVQEVKRIGDETFENILDITKKVYDLTDQQVNDPLFKRWYREIKNVEKRVIHGLPGFTEPANLAPIPGSGGKASTPFWERKDFVVRAKKNKVMEFSHSDVQAELKRYREERGLSLPKEKPHFETGHLRENPGTIGGRSQKHNIGKVETFYPSPFPDSNLGHLKTLTPFEENLGALKTLPLTNPDIGHLKTLTPFEENIGALKTLPLTNPDIGRLKTLPSSGGQDLNFGPITRGPVPSPATGKIVGNSLSQTASTVPVENVPVGKGVVSAGAKGVETPSIRHEWAKAFTVGSLVLGGLALGGSALLKRRQDEEDYAASSPHHSLYRSSHPRVVEGFQHGGMASELRQSYTEFGTGYDPVRGIAKLVGFIKEGMSVAEEAVGYKRFISSAKFQQALGKGKVIGKLGAGGYGEVEELEGLYMHGDQALPFRMARKSYNMANLPSERLDAIIDAEVEGLKALQETVTPTFYAKDMIRLNNGKMVPALYMESISGGQTLSDVFRKGGIVTPGQKKELVEAFKDLHSKGQSHGDLKPANVLVNKDGKIAVIDPMPRRVKLGRELTPAELGLNQAVDLACVEIITGSSLPNEIRRQAQATTDILAASINATGGGKFSAGVEKRALETDFKEVWTRIKSYSSKESIQKLEASYPGVLGKIKELGDLGSRQVNPFYRGLEENNPFDMFFGGGAEKVKVMSRSGGAGSVPQIAEELRGNMSQRAAGLHEDAAKAVQVSLNGKYKGPRMQHDISPSLDGPVAPKRSRFK